MRRDAELRVIGAVAMVVDHIGAVFFPAVVWWRVIGRLAFPIFAYGVGQGWKHTRDREAYMGRLVQFAVLAQIPYVLVFGDGMDYMRGNIGVTFVVALVLVWVWQEDRTWFWLSCLPVIYIVSAFDVVSYGLYGVACVWVFCQDMPKVQQLGWQVLLIALGGTVLQGFAVVGVWLSMWYRSAGRIVLDRRVFYYGYPAHLVVLAILRVVFE